MEVSEEDAVPFRRLVLISLVSCWNMKMGRKGGKNVYNIYNSNERMELAWFRLEI
jgi:hypothetical protein